ncbi:MAG: DUF4430 domain-containing protein [Planctomycetales bacterium]|nr:DUF4430 domain-containing protein [Planctomycetales bacterium]NIP68722.1 DUF4430 domain-containing protein [Planctomycetales bacterium]
MGCDRAADPPAVRPPTAKTVAQPENAARSQNDGLVAVERAADSIRVTLDFGDQAAGRWEDVPWQEGMTVLDALLALKSSGVVVQYRGRGGTAFVESVNGVRNSGSGFNWLYYVNHKKADRGAGAYLLKKGDLILWKYSAEK